MAPRIHSAGAGSVSVIVLGLLLQGCGSAGATPGTAEKSAVPATAAAPMVKSGTTLMPWGPRTPKCPDDMWKEPAGNKVQTIKIEIVGTDPAYLKDPDPPCAKETINGRLEFQIVKLPKDHILEVQFDTRYDVDGKPRKGPFKRSREKERYPVAGRCVMTADGTCTFDSHDREVPLRSVFSYTVYLYDKDGQLLDEKDPGIMVTDTP